MPTSPNPPPNDPDHRHAAWLTRDQTAPRVAFPQSDIPIYWGYADQFTLCDTYFTDVAGPSTPNHLMLIMGDSRLDRQPVDRLPQAPWTADRRRALAAGPARRRRAFLGQLRRLRLRVHQVHDGKDENLAAVFRRGLWPQVAIFITWDDW
ncbi:MAG TPA: alkaline phosphatase family protein [Candidatus Dormibacteraeota bacterium]|nr:alkaline phosphatase family protein [Candidatus Dormibacteraeota bacterium]